MKRPVLWTPDDWMKCGDTTIFNKHHGTNVGPWLKSSETPQGRKSLSALIGVEKFRSHDSECYEKYVQWFNAHYTKLGQILE